MRKGGRVFILLGVVLAIAAAILAIVAFSDSDEDADDDPDQVMVSVVEAVRDIPANQVITEDDVEVTEVEEGTVASNTARTPGQVIGLAAAGDIVSGQRVLMANLSTPGLSHLIEDGMRAVAVPIDRVNALGGMIRSDDRIDLIYSMDLEIEDRFEDFTDLLRDQQTPDPVEGEELPPIQDLITAFPFPGEHGSIFAIRTSDGNEPVTKLILQNIRVVRVIAGDVTVDEDGRFVVEEATNDDDENADENDAPTEPDRLPSADLIVLEVTPEAAELVKFILDYDGRFQVALRSPDDGEEVETPGMTYRQMVEDLGLPIPLPIQIPEEGEGQ